MAVFDVLPRGLFGPLAAPGAPTYLAILLDLQAEAKRQAEPLSRDLAIDIVYRHVSAADGLDQTTDATSEGDSDAQGDPVLTRANAILRYLTARGWLQAEMESDFSSRYVFPTYAFRLLALLDEIARNEPPPLAGLIYTIHSVLQQARREGADFGVIEAARHTEQLLNGLKELHHNIGRHLNHVLAHSAAQEVLAQLFGPYQTEIVDRAYHQLRTTDHVSRYRPAILDAVRDLTQDTALQAVAERLTTRREAASTAEALTALRDQLRQIRDGFETLDARLGALDDRHHSFVHAAVRAIELHLAASTTTSGQLNGLLERAITRPEAGAEIVGLPQIFRYELWDGSTSLATPGRAPQAFAPEPAPVASLTQEDLEAARAETLRQLAHSWTRSRVRALARGLLDDRPKARASELRLDKPNDLAGVIYLRHYGAAGLGYRVEPIDGERVRVGDFEFNDFHVIAEVEAP